MARAGELFAVCEPAGAADLLALVARVAAGGGDGAELARRAAELTGVAAISCAAAGTNAAGAVAMFVCGQAVAEATNGSGEVRLAGPAPVWRIVAGPVSAMRLNLPGAGTAHPLVRLDAGVVGGAGLAVRFPAPFRSVLLIPGHAPPPPDDGPTVDTHALVEGVDCRNGHFNDPAVRFCHRCGIAMHQATQVSRLGPRPPLGVLLLDNGMTIRVDADYVVGRDPDKDSDVCSGRARPLRIVDSYGGISRRHLRVRLVGWNVQVADLGSANGTFLQAPGDDAPTQLPTGGTVGVSPGTKVHFGRRWLRYESHRDP